MTTLAPVSVALKFGFLAVLYLFLLWVARSARRDLRGATAPAAPAPAAARADPGRRDRPALGLRRSGTPTSPRRAPRLVVERAPGHEPGMIYDLDGDLVLGRGDAPRSAWRTRSPPRATPASTSRATSW